MGEKQAQIASHENLSCKAKETKPVQNQIPKKENVKNLL